MSFAEKIADAYRPKIERLLSSLAEDLREAGFEAEGPYEGTETGEYQWRLRVHEMDAHLADVELTIMESMQRDEEMEQGVSFSLEVTSFEGDHILQMTPFNYSERVWVDGRDDKAVADRWHVFEAENLISDVSNEILEFNALGA